MLSFHNDFFKSYDNAIMYNFEIIKNFMCFIGLININFFDKLKYNCFFDKAKSYSINKFCLYHNTPLQ